MGDLGVAMWKEVRDMMGPSKVRNQMLISIAIFLVIMDVLLPFSQRNYEGSLVQILGFSTMIGILVCITSTPDLVAGERERHTLETLLSTRLSDRHIMLGKLLVIMGAALILTIFTIVQGIVVVSLLYGRWDLTPRYLGLAPLVIVLAATLYFLLTNLGLIVSARAQTVQGAQQLMGLTMVPFLVVVTSIPFLFAFGTLASLLPLEGTASDPVALLWLAGTIAFVVFLGLGILLFLWCLSRFRRPRLMLQ